mgnify:FL=1
MVINSMFDKEQLIKKLTKDIEQLEAQLTNREKYNTHNKIKRALINIGIAADNALPFILATAITSQVLIKNSSVFKNDNVEKRVSIETIDTSNGTHLEHKASKLNYNKESLEYSTGWIINDKGLYQRTVTTYKISKEIDLNNTDKILSMSKEEIDSMLVITNIKTIQKNTLASEDYLYNEDALIITNHKTIKTKSDATSDMTKEHSLTIILIAYLSLVTGAGASKIKKILGETYISDKLKTYALLYEPISFEELLEIEATLEIKKQNLALLKNVDVAKSSDDNYARILKRS